jgi:hypothetical protein
MYRLLVSGYPTTTAAIAWPEGNIVGSVGGPGSLNAVPVGNPAAGADWSVAFAFNARTWIHAVTATLTTSATAANRIPTFYIQDSSGNLVWKLGATAAQIASKTAVYNLGEAATCSTDANGNVVVTLPSEALILNGGTIGSVTTNIQAADQWSAIEVDYEQWRQV